MNANHLPDALKPGAVIATRYRLQHRIAEGGLSVVWEARDQYSNTDVAVKFLRKFDDESIGENYSAYLREIEEKLTGQPLKSAVLPIASGVFERHLYLVLPLYSAAISLHRLISPTGLHPRPVLEAVSLLGTALVELHNHSIVHGDLKPSNILLNCDPEPSVLLIDFGMARTIGVTGSVEFVGTYAYLPPALIETIKEDKFRSATRNVEQKLFGPFIDLHALGVITLELLVGSTDPVEPLTENAVDRLISQRNSSFSTLSEVYRTRITNLIVQLLACSPFYCSVSADSVAALARDLSTNLAGPNLKALLLSLRSHAATDTSDDQRTARMTRNVRRVRKEVVERTVLLELGPGTPATIIPPQLGDDAIIKLDEVFSLSRGRVQTSWILGMALSIVSYSLIVILIAMGAWSTLVSGQQKWGAIFGGLGLSTLIGTLIWRPLDRIFSATVLAQQIEMIHVRATAGLQGTLQIKERLKIIDEAINSLRIVLRESAGPAKKRSDNNRSS